MSFYCSGELKYFDLFRPCLELKGEEQSRAFPPSPPKKSVLGNSSHWGGAKVTESRIMLQNEKDCVESWAGLGFFMVCQVLGKAGRFSLLKMARNLF